MVFSMVIKMKYLILLILVTALILPASASDAPNITSWSNNHTNDDSLELEIDVNETVNFNVTVNQTINIWNWTLDGIILSSSSNNNTTITFDNEGDYEVGVNGSNINGTTQTIVWNVTVEEEKPKMKSGTPVDYSPQVVDYVYVNDTVNETINYWIITDELMTNVNWTVDGMAVEGTNDSNNYSYEHIWNNTSIDEYNYHTIVFKANDTDSQVEFRWYVNVYEIDGYLGGDNIFDMIDDALENHTTELKIRMFKYKMAKVKDGDYAFAAQKVNRLHDEIAKRQMTREAILLEYKAGNINNVQYVAALKQAQRDAKYNEKLAQELAKALKQAGYSSELVNILGADDDQPKNKGKHTGQLKDQD